RAGNHPYPPPLRLAPRVGSANRTAIRAGAVRGSLDCLSARSVIPAQCETFPSVRDCPVAALLHSCWRARESIEHVLVFTRSWLSIYKRPGGTPKIRRYAPALSN